MEDTKDALPSSSSKLTGLNDASDEFFDVPEPSDHEHDRPSESLENCYVSSATGFVKKLHDLEVQKKGYMDLQDGSWESNAASYRYGSKFPKDYNFNLPCSWTSYDPYYLFVAITISKTNASTRQKAH